jgi:hypothetical protein
VLEAYSALSFRNHGSLLRQPGIWQRCTVPIAARVVGGMDMR